MFESVDARTDGHRLDGRLESHTICSPWAFGSGELKMCCQAYRIIGYYDDRLIFYGPHARIYKVFAEGSKFDNGFF